MRMMAGFRFHKRGNISTILEIKPVQQSCILALGNNIIRSPGGDHDGHASLYQRLHFIQRPVP